MKPALTRGRRGRYRMGARMKRSGFQGLAGWTGRLTVLAACALATAATAQSTNQILTVSPTNAAQGTGGRTVTFKLDTDAPPVPPAGLVTISLPQAAASNRFYRIRAWR